MEELRAKTSSKGQVNRCDFIEFSIDAKLLDLADVSSSRKTVGSKGKGRENRIRL